MNYNILETYPAPGGKTYYLIHIISGDIAVRFKFDSDISDDLIQEHVAKYIEDMNAAVQEETNEESQNQEY